MGKVNAKKKTDAPLKTYINFVEIEEKKETSWKMFFPGVILIVILAGAFAKFCVVDMYAKADRLKGEVAQMQLSLENDLKIISESNDINDVFYHYTWYDMDSEEKDRIPRTEIFELIEDISDSEVHVESFSIQNNVVLMDVYTDSQYRMMELSKKLSDNPDIESMNISALQVTTLESGESIKQSHVVIYMKSLSARSEEQ